MAYEEIRDPNNAGRLLGRLDRSANRIELPSRGSGEVVTVDLATGEVVTFSRGAGDGRGDGARQAHDGRRRSDV